MIRDNDVAVIENALVDVFGYEASIPFRAIVASSPRYGVLLAIAGHVQGEGFAYERLKRSVAKIAKNPKTRAILR